MDVKIWYSKDMRQWRWSMIDPVSRKQESGQQFHIRDAMNDIANTIEYMVERHEYGGEDES